MDTMLLDAAEALLTDVCTPQTVRGIEAGGDPRPLWQHVADAGFADALVSEAHGGAGLGLHDAFGVLLACGRHAVPVPLASTLLARGWLDATGQALPQGPIGIAAFGALQEQQAWSVRRLALAAQAGTVLAVADGGCWQLDLRQARVVPDGVPGSLAGAVQGVTGDAAHRVGDAAGLLAFAAAGQAAMLAGAADRVLALSLRYVQERAQFGRSIGKFQAIQHQLAVMAQHAALMRMAAEIACDVAPGRMPRLAAVAAGMAVCTERAGEVAAIGHAVHGAIGVTTEHDLQLYTRRLHQWSTDLGSAAYWATQLGEIALAQEHSALDVLRLTIQAETAD